MSKNLSPTVNQVFARYAYEYMKQHYTTDYERRIIHNIISCRTEKLGGRIEICDKCGYKITLYNSCRNRHCPLCQFMKKEKWVIDKKNEVLPYQYFHAVFTIPDELNTLVYMNKKIMYKYLFDIVKKTLFEVTGNKKYFGVKIGFFAVLHTWGQKLNLHPHIHCVIPGGGYRNKKDKWINAKKDYLVPIDVLKPKFKYNFLTGLKIIYKNKGLFLGKTKYNNPQLFQSLIDKLIKKEWIIYLKESFKNSKSVIEYLSRYTHRIAISNYRIKDVKNDEVYFEYRDYKDNNKKRIKCLPVFIFIKRFLYHVVPYRFVRIRYYGLLSNRNKSRCIKEYHEYYKIQYNKKKEKNTWQETYLKVTGIDVCKCKKCGKGKMIIKEVITVKNRAPPVKIN